MGSSQRIALVEPYFGGSHRAWAQGYAAHSAHDVELFALPGAHWKWRMQGAHVDLARRIERAVAESGPFEAVVASSMTNLPALLGQARRALGDVPAVLFMHESQLTYPISPDGREDLTYAMINWTSMVAADLVVFNSEYHRRTWFGALPTFLGRLPDRRHIHLVDEVSARSIVLPVGADLRALDPVDRTANERPLVLWNQRWEHDKRPECFAAAVTSIAGEGLAFDLALAGERSSESQPELRELRETLGDRIVHDGFAEVEEYRRLLRRADVVVSTADHEFFGLAVSEAIYAGAFPVLPDRVVYPERVPRSYHSDCLYATDAELAVKLRWAITHPTEAAAIAAELGREMADLDWSVVAPEYDAVLENASARSG